MQSGISKNECDAAKECNCTAVNNGHNGFQRGTKTIESVTKEESKMSSRDGVEVLLRDRLPFASLTKTDSAKPTCGPFRPP